MVLEKTEVGSQYTYFVTESVERKELAQKVNQIDLQVGLEFDW